MYDADRLDALRKRVEGTREYEAIRRALREAAQGAEDAREVVRTPQSLEPLNEDAAPVVELVNAASVTPEPVDWLWNGWLARGKLHILAGAPGTGKTTLALALAATVTTAGRWPDGTRCPHAGDVVIWSGEDDPADTLVPRLMAAGADLRRVHFVGDVRAADGVRAFDPAKDAPLLMTALERIRPALLIVDPIVSAVAADSHKNTEVRRALQPLVDLAARLDCALLGVSHLSKNTAGRSPTERVTGSIAFSALARLVMLAAKRENPEPGEAPRLLVRAKSNIGDDSGGVGYDLGQVEPAPGIFASRVLWAGAVEGSARELLAQAEAVPDAGEPDGALGDAVAFLRGLLSDGPLTAKEIKSDADAAGYSWRTIHRAADKPRIEKRKEGGGFGGRGAVWRWYLPGESTANGAQDADKMTRCQHSKGWHLVGGLASCGKQGGDDAVQVEL
jgi:putative DNA primase/helicase